MLAVVSPAKSLDFDSALATTRFTLPRQGEAAERLIDVMRGKSVDEVASLMHISADLAALNVERYRAFEAEPTPGNARPAVLAFNGDVYQGMRAREFDARDFTEAQKTLRILSGLYGVLRPLDLIQPYRLEMSTKLRTERGRTLYQWWGDRLAAMLSVDLEASPGANVLVNLASGEYFDAVDTSALDAKVVSPRFEDRDAKGRPRIVSFYAKRARGSMASWLVRNRVRSAAALRTFDVDGYAWDEARSTSSVPVFIR
ncbi:MAG: peroxide stress protein YaaA [Arachnia sp.]